MRVTITIPEELCAGADRAAANLRLSRSKLISMALDTYLLRFDANRITEQLNIVYASEQSELPDDLSTAQLQFVDDHW